MVAKRQLTWKANTIYELKSNGTTMHWDASLAKVYHYRNKFCPLGIIYALDIISGVKDLILRPEEVAAINEPRK